MIDIRRTRASIACVGHSASPHLRDRLDDGLVHPPLAGAPRALSKRPDAVLLLGQVGQLEVEAEGPDQDFRLLWIHVGQVGRQRLALTRAPAPRRSLIVARLIALYEIESVRAFLFDDHLAEQRAQQLDLARQRIPGGRRADAARLRPDRSVRWPPRLACPFAGQYRRCRKEPGPFVVLLSAR